MTNLKMMAILFRASLTVKFPIRATQPVHPESG